MSQFYPTIIKAGNGSSYNLPGKVLSVKLCSSKFVTVSFDGKAPKPIFSGTVHQGPFKSLNFFNGGTTDATVNFYVGDQAVDWAPSDNQATNAKSFIRGNLGIADGTGAAGGNPASNIDGVTGISYLAITNGLNLVLPGTVNGLRRQFIVISVAANSPAPLIIRDPNSQNGGVQYSAVPIVAGAQVNLVTDSDLNLSGAGGTANIVISETFLNNA